MDLTDIQEFILGIASSNLSFEDLSSDQFIELITESGIDLTHFTNDEIDNLLDLFINTNDVDSILELINSQIDVSQFDPNDWVHNILYSDNSFKDLVDNINKWQSVDEIVRRDALIETIDQYNFQYFNSPEVKENISRIEYNIGSNLSSYIRHSEISFKGVEKLLSLNSYNIETIASKVAKMTPDTLVTEKSLQSVFDAFLKILGIKS